MGCSQPDLAEFYENASVTEGKVSSTVNGVELQKKVKAHVIDEVGSSTFMGCGFELLRKLIPGSNRACKHLLRLFLAAGYLLLTSSESTENESWFCNAERAECKMLWGPLLSLLVALNAKLNPSAPWKHPCPSCFNLVFCYPWNLLSLNTVLTGCLYTFNMLWLTCLMNGLH